MNNENILIKHRVQLYGIAALGVIIGHSTSVINYHNNIAKVLGYGGIGVYIFALLSGIGLHFSMKNRRGSKADFYRRRLIRTFLPYILISGLWYGVKYLFIQHDILSFFYELSTASFWVEHKGAWYVAMLIPLYLIYPWYHNWVERGNRKKKFIVAFSVWIGLTITIGFCNMALYDHLSQVLSSVLIFLVGNYLAEKIYHEQYNLLWLCLFGVLFFIVKTLFTSVVDVAIIANSAFAFLGASLAICFAWILDRSEFKLVKNLLGFLGKYSLELYLTNIYLLQAYKYFHLDAFIKNVRYGLILMYLIIAFVGIFSSWIFGMISINISSSKVMSRK